MNRTNVDGPARWILLVTLGIALLHCAPPTGEPQVRPVDSPAPPGAQFPSLDARDGRLLLSWIEPAQSGDGGSEARLARIRVSERSAEGWGESSTVAEGDRLMINWADFPEPRILDAETIAMHWLVRAGGPQWAYGIRFAIQTNDGEWSVPRIPHGQDHAAEHGFVSLLPGGERAADAIWLDGREMARGGTMELRHAGWDSTRGFDRQRVIDPDVCSCCQTDAVRVGNDLLVVYRDHAAGEIRDISMIRRTESGWEAPSRFSDDGWHISACPVNGPAIDAQGDHVVVTWFTQAKDEPKVLARFSTDGGHQWSPTLRIDQGDPIGRVDVSMLADGGWAVSWLENETTDAAILLRRFDSERGALDEAIKLGQTGAQRDSGFPQIGHDGQQLWATWTETSRPSRVRLSMIRW